MSKNMHSTPLAHYQERWSTLPILPVRAFDCSTHRPAEKADLAIAASISAVSRTGGAATSTAIDRGTVSNEGRVRAEHECSMRNARGDPFDYDRQKN
jgi:hypothetical protein